MALEQIRLFKDIAQARSLSRAAAMNGVSQSAASQHVQELERAFGCNLLDRSTRPVTLTPAGRLYFEFCRDVLRKQEEFEVALSRLKGEVDGSVTVASIYSVGLSDMSRLEGEFRARHPVARLHVEYLRPEKVLEAVLEDRADLGLVSFPEATRELGVIPWRREEMVLAAAPSHPLAGRAMVCPADLEGIDFVAFDDDLKVRREVDRYLRELGVAVRVAVHFDVVQMIKEAVALGSGVSILPRRAMTAEMEQGRLVAVPLEPPGLCRPLGIVHRRRKKFNRATLSLLDMLLRDAGPV